MTTALIQVSIGELIDKITILEIKLERILDTNKLANISTELSLLKAQETALDLDLGGSRDQLREVNEHLWDVEDALRQFEAAGRFDDEFVQLARRVYELNDERSQIKRRINIASGSDLIEEKSYGSD